MVAVRYAVCDVAPSACLSVCLYTEWWSISPRNDCEARLRELEHAQVVLDQGDEALQMKELIGEEMQQCRQLKQDSKVRGRTARQEVLRRQMQIEEVTLQLYEEILSAKGPSEAALALQSLKGPSALRTIASFKTAVNLGIDPDLLPVRLAAAQNSLNPITNYSIRSSAKLAVEWIYVQSASA
ncbi:hypothetical protein CYMTET_39067 [Cymbomonas tetramitiformis]|uniref:Uncharacterized protein n=1 Tax=Cymbomonas tetramitiformis TaxID=36881 RepID=A0AAE0CCI3_9CHLO|nr:hypothetical protein CYMTET_39067 [Cymbomonas tetramitiformis]